MSAGLSGHCQNLTLSWYWVNQSFPYPSDKYQCYKSLAWLDRKPNSQSPACEARALPIRPLLCSWQERTPSSRMPARSDQPDYVWGGVRGGRRELPAFAGGGAPMKKHSAQVDTAQLDNIATSCQTKHWLLELYILAAFKVTSQRVQTCDSGRVRAHGDFTVLPWETLGDQTASTMTQYHTQVM